ncbi:MULTISPECIES: hypothetical protein [Ralstonia solanacearum species complex]|uniref:hypothetical protein n=1 Tax=Ralstonia solanacearum species complex TaxID=3116862 RepID=UPI001071ADDE|nr:hypothetical protein [Ralstonia solanacearum]
MSDIGILLIRNSAIPNLGPTSIHPITRRPRQHQQKPGATTRLRQQPVEGGQDVPHAPKGRIVFDRGFSFS